MTQFLESTFTQSPIGTIPRDYMRLQELCKAASITYTNIVKDGANYRIWKIVADKELAVNKKGRITGSGSTKFHKFCLLLDLISFENPGLSNIQIIGLALEPNTHRDIMSQKWQDIHNHLAKIGVPKYEILRTKSGEENTGDFDL